MKFGGMPDQLASTFKPGTSRLNLAYKISGKFKTAFPDGKPSAAPTPGPEEGRASIKPGPPVPDPNQIKESKQPTTIIVVGDVDMISDRYSVNVSNFFGQEIASALNDNLAFISNASENLTGSEDLIALRSRGRSQRPFTRVAEIEKKAQEQYREQAKDLQKKLDDANKRINEMQQGTEGTDQKRIVDQAFMKELAKFREDQASTAKQLREVKRHLRENVEKLQARVMFTNIALIPLVVTILSIGIAFYKSRRRRVAQ